MEITANTIQTVQSNGNVIFTDTPVSGNCSIMHREGSGLVKLRGLCNSQCRARFKAYFSGNIALPATGTAPAAISLAISVDGEAVDTTTMTVTPAAVSRFNNVSSAIYLDVPKGCCSTIAVRNVTPDNVAIEVRNANLIVERVA